MESNHYPMPREECGARTRAGGSCRQPAMKNGRCRLHGGKSLSGAAHGRYRHGMRTKEALKEQELYRDLLKGAGQVIEEIKK